MSVLPFLLNLADELTDITSGDHYDDHDDFGFGIIHPQEIRRVQRSPLVYLTHPRWRRTHCPYTLARRNRSGVVDKIKHGEEVSPVGKDGFQVCMDVAQFKPNELTVKTVDNTVVVEGTHEEREDEHGFISRQFVRKYTLPKGYDPKELTSTLSSDGILTLKAPPPLGKGQKGKKERLVQIQHTGPAHLTIKDNPKEGEQQQQQQQQQNGEPAEKMQD